mmetsp:Transcript_12266/g.38717  ORF Transcript_12266/g.38717 Transcript_12266/m.38717 type:complete len:879 (-) Transcript_12266:150-2786(-)
MRLVPQRRREHDLHLLPAGERAHARVRAVLGLEANILELLLDHLARERPDVHALHGGDLLVDDLDELEEELAQLLELVERHEDVCVVRLAHPLELVLILLLLVLPAQAGELVDDALHLVHLELLVLELERDLLLQDLLLLLGQRHGRLLDRLLVLAGDLVAPSDVLVGRLGQVVLDQVEGVLRDVRDAHGRVLPHVASLRDVLADEQLDHRRLARAVGAEDRDARGERDLHGDALDGRDRVLRVSPRAVLHLHERLALGLDALDVPGLREVHRELGRLELKVGLGGRVLLDKVGQVALVHRQLEVLHVQNVRRDALERLRVVRREDGRHVLQAHQVVLHPLDVHHVQVVGRLVEEEDVRLLQHRARERELHAPAAGEGRHGVARLGGALVVEADGVELRLDLLGGDAVLLDVVVVEHVLDARQVRLLAHDVRLDEDGAHERRVGEALDLALGDRAHQRRLAAVVLAEQAVTVATLEPHLRVEEKDFSAVRERELAVAQLLRVVLLLLGRVVDARVRLALVADRRGRHLCRCAVHRAGRGEVAHDGVLPVVLVVAARVGERAAHRRHVVDEQLVVERRRRRLNVADDDIVVRLAQRALLALLLNALHLLERVVAHRARLRVRHVLRRRLEERHDLRHEDKRLRRLLDELGHVRHNLRAHARERVPALLEATLKQRGHGGERGGGDDLHEDDAGVLVDGLLGLARVHHVDHEVVEHLLDILVLHGVEELAHRLLGLVAHLRLEVGQARGHQLLQVGEHRRHLRRRLLRQLAEQHERAHDRLPLLRDVHVLHADRHEHLHSRAVRHHRKGLHGLLRGGLHALHLVGEPVEHLAEQWHEVRLRHRRALLAQRRAREERALAQAAVLLARRLHRGLDLGDQRH